MPNPFIRTETQVAAMKSKRGRLGGTGGAVAVDGVTLQKNAAATLASCCAEPGSRAGCSPMLTQRLANSGRLCAASKDAAKAAALVGGTSANVALGSAVSTRWFRPIGVRTPSDCPC